MIIREEKAKLEIEAKNQVIKEQEKCKTELQIQ